MTDYQTRLEAHIPNAQLPIKYDVTYKTVFGARAAYVNDKIFASYGRFGFAKKLPDDVCSDLFDKSVAAPLRYFEKGHVKRNYAVVNEGDSTVALRLNQLIAESVQFAQK